MEDLIIRIIEWLITCAPWLAPFIFAIPWLTCIPCWVVGLPAVGSFFGWIFYKLGINVACKIRKK